MAFFLTRRGATLAMLAVSAAPFSAIAQTAEVWSAEMAADGLQQDLIRMIDIRSRQEWTDTGVAANTWPISLHEGRFAQRLFAARETAEGRPVALICATGGRTGSVMRSLRQAGYSGFLDISEGMLGSAAGPGWVAGGLPIISAASALAALPRELI